MAPKPDGMYEQRPNRTTRRRLLAGVGVAVGTAIAGCSGDGNDDGSSEDGDDGESSGDGGSSGNGGDDSDNGNGDSGDDTDSSESSGGSDCPDPSSFEYVEQVLDDENNALPSMRFEIPESSEVQPGSVGIPLSIQFAGGELTMSVIPTGMEDISLEEFAEGATGEESTDQYDFAAEGARSWTLGSSGEVPIRIEVYVQDDEQVSGLRVGTISSNPTEFCPETINGILAHIVESFELA